MRGSARDPLELESAGGRLRAHAVDGQVAVDMGPARLDWRDVPLARIVMVGSAVYILTLTPLTLPTGAGVWSVLLGIGLLSNINTLCYPILSRHFPPGMTGRATTALNSFFFIGAFFVQFAIGLVIASGIMVSVHRAGGSAAGRS